MADTAHALVLDALTRAAAAPDGLPLLAGKAGPGLFAATAAGKAAAQRCQDDGLLRVVRSETRGKARHDLCGLTDRGLAFLLQHASPRPVLEALVQALQARQRGLDDIADRVRQSQHDLQAFQAAAGHALERLGVPPECNGKHEPDVAGLLRAQLTRWRDADRLGDCPLPELFRLLRADAPQLTIGQFHDHLRLLHQADQVYLHPWTGPLYELPEPACALLVGHEVAYYASLRG